MIPRITMLNVMAGRNFTEALDRLAGWGLETVDLKNGIYGKSIADLTPAEAAEAAEAMRERGLSAYCFSTEMFHDDIEQGERYFRERFLNKIEGLLRTADTMKPELIRLLAARTARRADIADSTAFLREEAPWLIELYREAIDEIHSAGFRATIENEAHRCIWSTPSEVCSFFEELDRRGKVHFTYDVQNMWQMGTYPSMQAYEELKPWIGFLHLKGGQTDGTGEALVWKSALQDASWPVSAITKQAIRDGVSPVICLNPSHGKPKAHYSYDDMYERDLDYVRALIEETAEEMR